MQTRKPIPKNSHAKNPSGGGEVRIIGGAWRGRKIAVPSGGSVRPTSDRAREAIFNRLVHGFAEIGFRLPDARVVDLFAGTGAFGFEALSRGAASATFVDSSAGIVDALRTTVGKFGTDDRASVVLGDATALIRGSGNATLVFLDPPYGAGLLTPALDSLRARRWLAPRALVVAERDSDEAVPAYDGYSLIDTRGYGRASFLFLAAD